MTGSRNFGSLGGTAELMAMGAGDEFDSTETVSSTVDVAEGEGLFFKTTSYIDI